MKKEKTTAVASRGNYSTVKAVKSEYAMIDRLVREVMIEEKINQYGKVIQKGDYGKIPGCGDDLVLRKSGAQKINRLFKTRPEYRLIEKKSWDDGTVEFEYECDLFSIELGIKVSTGGGSCTSRESKYYYRNSTKVISNIAPEWYWEDKKNGYVTAKKRIKEEFGANAVVTKFNGDYVVAEKIQEVNPNHWDTRNTVKKQAMKRSYTESTVNMSACSNIFTQDIDFSSDYDEPDVIDAEIIPPARTVPAEPKAGKNQSNNAANSEANADHIGLPCTQKNKNDLWDLAVKKFGGDEAEATTWIAERCTRYSKGAITTGNPDEIENEKLMFCLLRDVKK